MFGRRTNEFGRRELFHRQEELSEGIREIDREQLGENSAVIKSRGGGGEGEGRRQNRGHTMVFQKWQGEFGSRDSSAGVKRDKSDNKPLYSIVEGRRDCWNIYPRNRKYLESGGNVLLFYSTISKDGLRYRLSGIDRYERSLRSARERDCGI